jgi:hypothetical protein
LKPGPIEVEAGDGKPRRRRRRRRWKAGLFEPLISRKIIVVL